jgi:hypothetical protein
MGSFATDTGGAANPVMSDSRRKRAEHYERCKAAGLVRPSPRRTDSKARQPHHHVRQIATKRTAPKVAVGPAVRNVRLTSQVVLLVVHIHRRKETSKWQTPKTSAKHLNKRETNVRRRKERKLKIEL